MKLFAFALFALVAFDAHAAIKTPEANRYFVAIKQLDDSAVLSCGRMVCELASETLGAGCAVNGGRVVSTSLTPEAASVVASFRCVESVMERGNDSSIDTSSLID